MGLISKADRANNDKKKAAAESEEQVIDTTMEDVKTPEETETKVEAKVEEKVEAEEPKAQEEVKPAKTKEVAVKQEAAKPQVVSVDGNDIFVTNPLLKEAAQDAGWDDFPTIKVSNGNHMLDGTKLGEEVTFHAIYAKPQWRMVPGSDDDESKEFFKVSDESKEDLEDAHETAIEAGYDEASIKEYFMITAIVKSAEKTDDYDGQFVVFQLAPSSVRQWKKVYTTCKVQAGLKRLNTTEIMEGTPEVGSSVLFKSTAEIGTTRDGNKEYTFLKFSLA